MKNNFLLPVIFTLGLLLFSVNVNAQKLSPIQQQKVNQLFKKSKVVYFKFPVTSMQEVSPLAKIISVDKTKGTTVFAHANKEAFSKFIVKNYPYTVVPHTAGGTRAKTANVKKK
jgi:hypothetical protein